MIDNMGAGPDGISEDKLPVDAPTFTHITAGDRMAGDEKAKKLICNKGTLAIIIKNIISDCSEYSYAELVGMIGNVSTEQHLTADINQTGIVQLPTEQSSISEKLLRYDVYLRFCDSGKPDEENCGRISTIDIEIQQENNLPYPLIKRGVYYSCRSICNQLGAVSKATDFSKLHKVYSIWLMVKQTGSRKAGVATYNFNWSGDVELLPENFEGNSDLIQIDFVFAGDLNGTDASKRDLFLLVNGMYRQPSLLRQLFTVELPDDTGFEREVEDFMTLSEDFFARGVSKGKAEGIAVGLAKGWVGGKEEEKAKIALKMYSLGAGKDFILKSTGLSEEEFDKLIKENEGRSTGETSEPYILN